MKTQLTSANVRTSVILEANPFSGQPRFTMMKGYLQIDKVKIPFLLKSAITARALTLTLTRLETENCQLEDDSNACYDNAFKTCMSEFVRAESLIGAKALEMSQLLERYIDLLLEVRILAPNYRSGSEKRLVKTCHLDKSQSELALKEGFIMDSISPTEPNCRDFGHG